MGLNFTIDMTWGRLILLSLSKKRPKNQSPDIRVAGKWWLSQCTVSPAAFWKCVFLGHPVQSCCYKYYNNQQHHSRSHTVCRTWQLLCPGCYLKQSKQTEGEVVCVASQLLCHGCHPGRGKTDNWRGEGMWHFLLQQQITTLEEHCSLYYSAIIVLGCPES